VQELAPLLADGTMASAFDDAQAHFDKADLTDALSRIQSPADIEGCLPCCRVSIRKEQNAERDRVLALAKTAFDAKDSVHVAMMLSLFKAFTGEAMRPDEIEGPKWERIGFQGSSPGTDLRGAGMIGVLQPLYLARERPAFLAATLAYCPAEEGKDFPFMIISLNLSMVSLLVLRSGRLNRLLRVRKPGSIGPTVHTLYCALMVACFAAWEQRGLGVEDFGTLRASLEQEARRRPARLILDFEHEQARLRGGVGGEARV
jgi:hypothetical protein